MWGYKSMKNKDYQDLLEERGNHLRLIDELHKKIKELEEPGRPQWVGVEYGHRLPRFGKEVEIKIEYNDEIYKAVRRRGQNGSQYYWNTAEGIVYKGDVTHHRNIKRNSTTHTGRAKGSRGMKCRLNLLNI